MNARPPGLRVLLVCSPTLLLLAGCDSHPTDAEPAANIQVVTVAPAPRAPMVLPGAAPTPAPSSTPIAPAIPQSLTDMRPHKPFTDPPLPPELLDDGGLRPLPPRPAR